MYIHVMNTGRCNTLSVMNFGSFLQSKLHARMFVALFNWYLLFNATDFLVLKNRRFSVIG